MNFASFNFSLLRMEHIETLYVADGGVRLHLRLRDPLSVRASHEFFSETLDFKCQYSVEWYEIVTDVEVDTMVPDRVWVRAVEEDVIPGFRVWRGHSSEQAFAAAAAEQKKKRSRTGVTGGATRSDRAGKRRRTSDDAVAGGLQPDEPAASRDDDVAQDEDHVDFENQHNESANESEHSEQAEWELLADFAESQEKQRPDSHESEAAGSAAAAAAVSADDGDGAAAAAEGGAPEGLVRPYKAVKKTTKEDVFHIPGFGSLRYNDKKKTLTAHCLCDKHTDQECRKQRTCLEGHQRGQGRPVGYLTLWLQEQHFHDSAKKHIKESTAHEERAQRERAREYFQALPGGLDFAQKYERQRKEGEPEEPDFARPIYIGYLSKSMFTVNDARAWAMVIQESPNNADQTATSERDAGGHEAKWKLKAAEARIAIGTSRDDFVGEGLRLTARQQDLIDTVAAKVLLSKRGQLAVDVLKDTYLDISQGHDRMKHSRADGVACTFTTSTLLYSYSEDRVVLPLEMMLMHGFPRSAIAPRSIGQRALKDMVGNGMSLPCLATMVWAFWVMRNRQFEAPQQTPLQILCPSRVSRVKQKQTPTPARLRDRVAQQPARKRQRVVIDITEDFD
ncbi:unnamed protein product [Symbiodinium sp. CCMP2592]|nr:unnamed protein product [Symbiodinium sp. CCMP2592]